MKNTMKIHGMQIDFENRTIRTEKSVIKLSPVQFKAFELLVKNPGKVFTREEMREKCWDQGSMDIDATSESKSIGLKAVDKCISRIRQKLGQYSVHIETIPNTGFRFREEQQLFLEIDTDNINADENVKIPSQVKEKSIDDTPIDDTPEEEQEEPIIDISSEVEEEEEEEPYTISPMEEREIENAEAEREKKATLGGQSRQIRLYFDDYNNCTGYSVHKFDSSSIYEQLVSEFPEKRTSTVEMLKKALSVEVFMGKLKKKFGSPAKEETKQQGVYDEQKE